MDEKTVDSVVAPAPSADPAPSPAPEPPPPSEPAAEATKPDSFVDPLLTADEAAVADKEPVALEDALAGDKKTEPAKTDDASEKDKPSPDAPKDEPAKDKEAEPAKDEAKDKPVEETKSEPEKPYEVKLPDGVDAASLDKPAFDKFVSLVKDGGLKAEKATELVALHQAEMQKAAQSFDKNLRDAITTFQKGWRDETLADEQIGGNRINTTVANARQVIAKYAGSPEQQKRLFADLKSTGMGVNVGVARLLNNIYNDIFREGRPTASNPPGGQAPSRDLAQVLFD